MSPPGARFSPLPFKNPRPFPFPLACFNTKPTGHGLHACLLLRGFDAGGPRRPRPQRSHQNPRTGRYEQPHVQHQGAQDRRRWCVGLRSTSLLLSSSSCGLSCSPWHRTTLHKTTHTEHTPNFPLKHAQKDLAFSLTLASQLGVQTKTAAAANGAWRGPTSGVLPCPMSSPPHLSHLSSLFLLLRHPPSEWYQQALAAGDSELDFSAVARAVDAGAKRK